MDQGAGSRTVPTFKRHHRDARTATTTADEVLAAREAAAWVGVRGQPDARRAGVGVGGVASDARSERKSVALGLGAGDRAGLELVARVARLADLGAVGRAVRAGRNCAVLAQAEIVRCNTTRRCDGSTTPCGHATGSRWMLRGAEGWTGGAHGRKAGREGQTDGGSRVDGHAVRWLQGKGGAEPAQCGRGVGQSEETAL